MGDTENLSIIRCLFVGKVRILWQGKEPSAIDKISVAGPLDLSLSGFEQDEQADLKHHGGSDKAVHHYPADHYTTWKKELGQPANNFKAGKFGENISTIGLTEKDICIGDTMRIGTAVVQVSQGRQPCWKLSAHTKIKEMAYLVQKTARTGWYYRVIDEGKIKLGDTIELLEQPHPDWTVELVTRARFNPRLDNNTAQILSEIEELYDGWRDAFRKKLASGYIEDQRARLEDD